MLKDSNNYSLYIHINKTNNKRYIGITSQVPEKRWGKDGKNYLTKNSEGSFHHTAFAPAILKYGWDGFEHVVERANLSKEEAILLEQEYIDKYKTTEKEFGYNCSKGGDGGWDIVWTNEETVAKIKQITSERSKNMWENSEYRTKMSQVIHSLWEDEEWRSNTIAKNIEGHNNPTTKQKQSENFTKRLEEYWKDEEYRTWQSENMTKRNNENWKDPEYRAKMSEQGKKNWKSEEYRKKMKEASDLRWSNPDLIEASREIMNKNWSNDNFKNKVCKKVMCVETNVIYESTRQAQRETNIEHSSISRACKKESSTAGGYHWRYA